MSDTPHQANIPDINSIIRNVTVLNLAFNRILAVKLGSIGKGDITADYALAFGILRRDGPRPISRLAEGMERSIPYTTQMVREMQESGYFDRVKSTEDQRINAVTLTPQGLEIAKKINVLVAETVVEKLSNLPNDEIRLLGIILSRATAPFLDEASTDPRSHLPT